jgi:hypothetical protein
LKIFEGYWDQDKRVGKGRSVWYEGDVYEGIW